jgi:hypothetical protein
MVGTYDIAAASTSRGVGIAPRFGDWIDICVSGFAANRDTPVPNATKAIEIKRFMKVLPSGWLVNNDLNKMEYGLQPSKKATFKSMNAKKLGTAQAGFFMFPPLGRVDVSECHVCCAKHHGFG